MTPEEALARLSTLTGLSAQEWSDVLSLPPDDQALVIQGYRDQDWARRPDTLAEVLAVLGVIGTVAGVVSGVAGAATAAAALRSL